MVPMEVLDDKCTQKMTKKKSFFGNVVILLNYYHRCYYIGHGITWGYSGKNSMGDQCPPIVLSAPYIYIYHYIIYIVIF